MNLMSVMPRFFMAHWTPSQADWLKLRSSSLPTSVTRPTRSFFPPATGWSGHPGLGAPAAATGLAAGDAAGLATGDAAGLAAGLATGLAAGLAATAGLAAGLAAAGAEGLGAVVAAAGGLVGAACGAGWQAASNRTPEDRTAAAVRNGDIGTEPPK